jgi:hypothetical protein
MLSTDQITLGQNKHGFNWKLSDKHYLVLWDKRDLPIVFRFCKLIRESHQAKKEELLDIWGNTLERKLNDHHIPATNLIPESLDMATAEDILTFKGVARICQLICLKSNLTGHTVAVGVSSSSAQAYNYKLGQEMANVQIETNGFFDPSGIRVWYGGTFGEGTPTNQYKESCVRDRASINNAVTFCRNTFVGNVIDHNQGTSGFTAAGVWEFSPLATE